MTSIYPHQTNGSLLSQRGCEASVPGTAAELRARYRAIRKRLYPPRLPDKTRSHDHWHYTCPIGPIRIMAPPRVERPIIFREIEVLGKGVAIERTAPRLILAEVCYQCSVSIGDLLGQRRHKPLVAARAIASHRLRARGLSLPRIGQIMGGRDHTTIFHLLRNYDAAGRWLGVRGGAL